MPRVLYAAYKNAGAQRFQTCRILFSHWHVFLMCIVIVLPIKILSYVLVVKEWTHGRYCSTEPFMYKKWRTATLFCLISLILFISISKFWIIYFTITLPTCHPYVAVFVLFIPQRLCHTFLWASASIIWSSVSILIFLMYDVNYNTTALGGFGLYLGSIVFLHINIIIVIIL